MNRGTSRRSFLPEKDCSLVVCRFLRLVHGSILFPAGIVFFQVLILFLPAAYGERSDGKDHFRKGKDSLEARRYAQAIEDLSYAQNEFPILGDYSLLYLSDAYHEVGDHFKSLNALRTLLSRYSGSPLMKKARANEIREVSEVSPEILLPLYEAYILNYPHDEGTTLLYGLYLKQTGEGARADSVFKKIYVDAGKLSSTAYAEMTALHMRSADLIERASNLIKKYEFQEAEQTLRKALSIDDGKRRKEILEKLAESLFKQKAYKEAAVLYDQINDIYSKARSLYRARDKEGFEFVLKELLKKNDKRVSTLLIAVAADKRREKNFEESLRIYGDVLRRYPSEVEEATWGMGWTYYISLEYKKAFDSFAGLYVAYQNPKYRYWQARSAEAMGENAAAYYEELLKVENNFYGVLSAVQTKAKSRGTVAPGFIPEVLSEKDDRVNRINMLLSLGMKDEANSELLAFAKKAKNVSESLYIISKFDELGEFKRSVELATKMPYAGKNHRFLYPLAFWDDIVKAAGKYDIDPLITLSVMREESRFDVATKSVAGARGLMQLMPKTAYRLDETLRLGILLETDIDNASNNIHLGTFYLKSLFEEFKSLAAVLAAYNAGEAAVREWQRQGNYRSTAEFIEDIPYGETRNYVKRVITSYAQYRKCFPEARSENGFYSLFGKL